MSLDYDKVARYFEDESERVINASQGLTEEESFRVSCELKNLARTFAHLGGFPELVELDRLVGSFLRTRNAPLDGDG